MWFPSNRINLPPFTLTSSIDMRFKTGLDFINKLRLIVYALLSLPLTVFIVVYLQSNKAEALRPLVNEDLIFPFAIAFFILCCVFILLAYLLFGKKIKAIKMENDLHEKLNNYASLTIARFVLFEAAIILSLAGLLTTAEKSFIVLFIAVLFIFSVEHPSLQKIIRHLRLSQQEKERLLGKDNKTM